MFSSMVYHALHYQSDDLDLPVVFVTAHDSFGRTGPKSAI